MEINAHEHDAKSYADYLDKIGRRYIYGSENGTEKERMTLNEQMVLTGLLMKQKHHYEFNAISACHKEISDCLINNNFAPFIDDVIYTMLNLYKNELIEILNKFTTPESALS